MEFWLWPRACSSSFQDRKEDFAPFYVSQGDPPPVPGFILVTVVHASARFVKSPRELAPAGRVCTWCGGQEPLRRAVGTKAGACRLGDAAPVAVTAQGPGHNGSCPQGRHQAAPLLLDLGDR